MDGAILDTAEQAAKGAGDGRISQADAVKIFEVSKDANKITDVEITTLAYVYHKYKWTDAAATWFANQLAKNEGLAKK